MARDFVCKLRASGGDYSKLSDWEAAIACDLTSSSTKVFTVSDRGSYDPSVDDGKSVTFPGGGTGTLKHINVDNYALIVNCSGTINTGTVSIDGGHSFTISDTGEQIGLAIIECYNDWPNGLDDSLVISTSWTTNSDHYVKIYVPKSERHTGKMCNSDGTYTGFTLVGSGTKIVVKARYTEIDGVALDSTVYYNNGIIAYYNYGNFVKIHNVILRNFGVPDYNYSGITLGDYLYAKVWNSIFIKSRIKVSNTSNSSRWIYIYNNTLLDCGIEGGDDGVTRAKNNLVYGGNRTCFSGVFHSDSDYNISSDDTAPGSNSLKNKTLSDINFVHPDYDNDQDLHIQSTSCARNAGINLSSDPGLSFTDDIDGDTRGETWDIGADEYVEGIEEETISINYQFDTVAKRLNLYESYHLNSLIKALGLEKAHAFDEIQSKESVKDHLINALQKKAALANYKIDAIQSILNTRSYLIDVFQGKFFTKTFPINSLAKKLRVPASHALDILLTLAEEYGIISAKFDEARFGYSLFNRIFAAYPINTVIKFIPTRQLTFDSLMTGIGIYNVDFNTVTSRLNEILSYNINGLIEKLEKELHKIDMMLQSTKEQEYDVNALLKKKSEIQQTIDSLLQIRGKSDYLIDALLLNAIKSEYDYDTFLSKTKEIGLESDTILAYLAAIASMNLDTMILKQNELSKLFDSILSRRLTAAEFIDAVIEKLGIDREYAMNTVLSTILERSHFVDTLAKRLNIDRSTLINIILGQAKAKDLSIDTIAKKLNVSTNYLVNIISEALMESEYDINVILSAIKKRHLSFDARFQKLDNEIQSALDTILQTVKSEDMALDTILAFLREGKIPFDLFVLGTVSTELALEALIEKANIQTQCLLDIILGTYTLKTCKLNTLLESTESRSILIDILTSLVKSKNISLDAIVEQLSISKELILDSVLERIGIPIKYRVNLLSSKAIDKKHVLDTTLSRFHALNHGIDSLLEIAAKEDYTIEALLNAFGLKKEFIFSIALARIGGLRLVLFDTLLGMTAVKYFKTDALFKQIVRRDVSSDVIVKLIVSKQLNTNTMLTESFTTSLFFDAFITLLPQKTYYPIDLMLQGVVRRALKASVNLISFLFIDEAKVYKSKVLGIHPDSNVIFNITPTFTPLYDIVVNTSPILSITTSTCPVINVNTSYIST